MPRWPIVCVGALVTATTVMSAPAHADPPRCDNGAIVMPDCPIGGLCTAMVDNRCVGPVVPDLLPPPSPVRVGIEGGIGIGS
jgi:hypothetical protein